MIRVFRHYIPRSLVILGLAEATVLFTSIYVGVTFRLLEFNPTDKLVVGSIWPKALAYTGLMLLLMAGVGLYQRGLRDDLRGIVLRVSVAFIAGLVVLAAGARLMPALSLGHGAFTIAFLMSAAGIVLFRTLVYRYTDVNLFRRRVLVLGTGRQAYEVERLRRRSDWRDMTLVGFAEVKGEPILVDRAKVIPVEGTLLELAERYRVDEIVVALEDRREHFPLGELLDCKMNGIEVCDLMRFFEQATGKLNVEALSPSALIFADGFIQAILKTAIRRSFDIAVSSAFLVVTWPLMVLAALAIWLETGRPVLYRQVRVGRNGRPFEILKFRSMTVNAEAAGKPQWARSDDVRVTRVGAFIRKTRIDELPQIINVLRGDMSFVGPRPERPEFVAELSRTIPFYELRHRVNPGITGWAQICYPYGASDWDAREKLQFDLYYIKNYSLFLDIMILLQTAQVILWGKGAR